MIHTKRKTVPTFPTISIVEVLNAILVLRVLLVELLIGAYALRIPYSQFRDPHGRTNVAKDLTRRTKKIHVNKGLLQYTTITRLHSTQHSPLVLVNYNSTSTLNKGGSSWSTRKRLCLELRILDTRLMQVLHNESCSDHYAHHTACIRLQPAPPAPPS